jgi:hypothetical protein
MGQLKGFSTPARVIVTRAPKPRPLLALMVRCLLWLLKKTPRGEAPDRNTQALVSDPQEPLTAQKLRKECVQTN